MKDRPTLYSISHPSSPKSRFHTFRIYLIEYRIRCKQQQKHFTSNPKTLTSDLTKCFQLRERLCGYRIPVRDYGLGLEINWLPSHHAKYAISKNNWFQGWGEGNTTPNKEGWARGRQEPRLVNSLSLSDWLDCHKPPSSSRSDVFDFNAIKYWWNRRRGDENYVNEEWGMGGGRLS